MDKEVELAIARLLLSSWRDIMRDGAPEHAALTPDERECIAPDVLARAHAWAVKTIAAPR